MPTYGYQCTKCNHTFEVFQKITDEPLTECEECKGEIKRILYPVGIVFKGSGFHINDYKKTSDNSKPEPAPKEPAAPAESSK